jgi:peroxiredoxin
MKYFLCAFSFLIILTFPLLAGPNIGDPCPDFTLPDTTYTSHSLSGYQGNVVFLNLGESW